MQVEKNHPVEPQEDLEPEYVDDVFEIEDEAADVDLWADASPLRSARLKPETEPSEFPEDPSAPPKKPVEQPIQQGQIPSHRQAANNQTEQAVRRPINQKSPAKPVSSTRQPLQKSAGFKRVFPHQRVQKTTGPQTSPENMPRIQPAPAPEPFRLPPPARQLSPVTVSQQETTDSAPTTRPANSAISTTIPEWFVLENILRKYAPLPKGSLILGVDDAGKPLVLSLEDPSLGAMLILGDRDGDNRKHIRAILASAEELNDPDLFQIDVITPNPAGFTSRSSTLRQVCDLQDDCVYGLLGDILSEVETRLRTRRQLPFQLLVLDQADALTDRLAEESLRFLRWILRRGPQVGIWPLASVESAKLESFDVKTFRAFGLRMYGKITESKTASRYTEIAPQVLRSLSPGSQGCFKIEENVIAFSIPELG